MSDSSFVADFIIGSAEEETANNSDDRRSMDDIRCGESKTFHDDDDATLLLFDA